MSGLGALTPIGFVFTTLAILIGWAICGLTNVAVYTLYLLALLLNYLLLLLLNSLTASITWYGTTSGGANVFDAEIGLGGLFLTIGGMPGCWYDTVLMTCDPCWIIWGVWITWDVCKICEPWEICPGRIELIC